MTTMMNGKTLTGTKEITMMNKLIIYICNPAALMCLVLLYYAYAI